MNNKTGITLVALVITIIVLLILAGVTIGLTMGENGLLNRTEQAKKEYTRGEVKEELEMDLGDITIKKNGQKLEKEEIIEKIGNKVVIIDVTDEIIQGEYKGYEIIIDENNKITVGKELTGAKPTAQIILLDKGEGIEKTRLQVIASVEDGEIQSIESKDGLTQVTENSNSDKIYEVTKNGKYRFKITGTNGRIVIVESEAISNLIEVIEAESILKGIEQIEYGGKKKIKVAATSETRTYSLNLIKHEGDLVLDGTSQVEGATLSNNKYQFGSTSDVATASANAQNTVVLKVDGNLTINSGVTLTAVGSNYGGPKGLIVYCTGTLTNNGEISMTARGAKAAGENVYLWKNTSGTFEYIPAAGGAGGAAAYIASSFAFANRSCRK